MFEAYGTDNYEAMVEIVNKADELMKKGTREQFDTAIQEMVESISEPFLRISIVNLIHPMESGICKKTSTTSLKFDKSTGMAGLASAASLLIARELRIRQPERPKTGMDPDLLNHFAG